MAGARQRGWTRWELAQTPAARRESAGALLAPEALSSLGCFRLCGVLIGAVYDLFPDGPIADPSKYWKEVESTAG